MYTQSQKAHLKSRVFIRFDSTALPPAALAIRASTSSSSSCPSTCDASHILHVTLYDSDHTIHSSYVQGLPRPKKYRPLCRGPAGDAARMMSHPCSWHMSRMWSFCGWIRCGCASSASDCMRCALQLCMQKPMQYGACPGIQQAVQAHTHGDAPMCILGISTVLEDQGLLVCSSEARNIHTTL